MKGTMRIHGATVDLQAAGLARVNDVDGVHEHLERIEAMLIEIKADVAHKKRAPRVKKPSWLTRLWNRMGD